MRNVPRVLIGDSLLIVVNCKAAYKLHLHNVQTSRSLKVMEQRTEGLTVATFEFCVGNSNIVNFCIFDMSPKKGHCYVSEVVCADEASSCLLHFIEEKVKSEGVVEFRFYCAPGKENFVISSLVYAAAKYSLKITLRFLEAGYSQNEATALNSSILAKFKIEPIQSPEVWFNLIHAQERFTVVRVDGNMLYSFEELSVQLNLNHQSSWLSTVKEVVADGTAFPHQMKYKKISWDRPLIHHPSILDIDVATYILPKKVT